MKSSIRLLLLFLLVISYSYAQQQVQGPVNRGDSLALLEIYRKAGGPQWNNTQSGNQPWDAKNPVSSWFGVELDANGDRVIRLNLAGNNLVDSISAAINALTELSDLNLAQNKIEDLPALPGLQVVKSINVDQNRLTFDDIDVLRLTPAIFSYVNQDSVGSRTVIPAYAGEPLELTTDVDPRTGRSSLFRWYQNTIGGTPIATGRTFTDSFPSPNSVGVYYYTIYNPDFPQDTLLVSKPIVVNFYNKPNPFPDGPLSFILTLTEDDLNNPTYLQDLQQNLIEAGGTKRDSCLCGTFQVWEFESIKSGDDIIIDPNSVGVGLGFIPPREDSTKPGFDINYRMMFGDDEIPNTKWAYDANAVQGLAELSNSVQDAVVAVIDLGVEASHPAFDGKMYVDNSSSPKGMDDCYTNDPSGVNLQNPMIQPFNDITGHGTHIANVVHSLLPKARIKIMSIQVGDSDTSATVFKVACGVEYALRHEVDVINISMGYLGENVPLLDSIMTTSKAKKTVMVTAAGNDGLSTDSNDHWPSNLAKDPANIHIFSVASFGKDSLGNFRISDHSNFGIQSVNIAAPGENIFSAVNDSKYGFKSGTSMAAGFVSAFAAALRASDPSMTPVVIREKFLGTNITVQEAAFETKIEGGRRLNVDIIDCFTQPQTKNDSAKLSWLEIAKNIEVYNNDCIGNKSITPKVIVLPTSGKVKWDSDKLTFRYSADFLTWILGAEDSFTYQVCPGSDQTNCSEAIVKVQKQGVGILGLIVIILLLIIILIRLIRRNSNTTP
ncbi:MAG: S8 family serine peptidase [Bacteroidia bacterium]|nr:S8 family serine peptidase [Bacteroidia bacterium]